MNPSKISLSGTIAKYAFIILLIGTPIFFLPFAGAGTQLAKVLLLVITAGTALIALCLSKAYGGEYTFPSLSKVLALLALPVIFGLGALTGGQIRMSLFGYAFELTTVLTLLALASTGLVASVLARKESFLPHIKNTFLVAFSIIVVYQVVRFLAPQDVLSFGQFFGRYGNLLGKWNDMAILGSLGLIAAYISLKGTQGITKSLTLLLLVISGLLMLVVSFSTIFLVTAAILLLYIVLDSREGGKITLFKKSGLTQYRILGIALIIVLLAYTFITSFATRLNSQGVVLRPNLYKKVFVLPNLIGGVPAEVRPSALTTLKIYKNQLSVSPLFGAGANRFSEAWAKFRPAELNQTQYWNSDFAFGFGYFPTLLVVGGLTGSLAVLGFLVYAFRSILILLRRTEDKNTSPALLYSTLLLLIMSVLYIPALALLVMLFVGVGYVFARTDRHEPTTKTVKKAPLLVCALVGLIFVSITLVEATMNILASRNYSKAAQAVTTDKNLDTADSYMQKTLSYVTNDVYLRNYAELLILKAQVIAEQGRNDKGELSPDAQKAVLAIYKSAEAFADRAISVYPQNYANYIYAGNVYSGDPETQDKAVDMYNKSLVYNPNNPDAYFGIAKVRANQGNIEAVKESLSKALEKKEYYTPALLAGAQLSAAQKDIDGTINLLVKAYRSDTSRADILLEVANIQYTYLKDTKAAIETLEYAVGTYPNYAEARLSLATLYAKVQKFEDAANLLVGIKTEDPKVRAALDQYIATLKSGKDPFVQSATTAPKSQNATSTKATTTKPVVVPKKK